LAANLHISKETPTEIANRIGGEPKIVSKQLKTMVKKGLIAWTKTTAGPAYGLLPFIVGIYENQLNRLDEQLARLFEEYYLEAFGKALSIKPQFHRVVPVGETVRIGLEIRPYESAGEIIHQASSWGVVNCICRTQKALIGDPCDHPIEVCMVLSNREDAFNNSPGIRALTKAEALSTLRRAAESGLVHSVSNNQEGIWYICNCCTCSCGILRGMSEMGIANVVASSAFVNTVDDELCLACGDCLEYCQFNALTLNDTIHINAMRCVGCGVCVLSCPEEALALIRRPEEDVLSTPVTADEWRETRAASRGISLVDIL
jgi:ferredoxin